MRALIIILTTFLTFGAQAENITFAGSSTIMPIMEAMVPVFKKNGIDVNIQGGGSSAGLKSVKMGMAEIGMVSRALTESELNTFEYLTLARDWVVIISNKASSLNDISSAEVIDLYTNPKNKEFHVVAKEDGRATKVIFDSYFNIEGKLRKDLLIIGANGQAIATIEKDPNAIAYVSYSAAYEAKKQGSAIKILPLNGIEGNEENVLSGKYKLARELNLVYLKSNFETVNRLTKVLVTPEANKVFKSHNVISTLTHAVAAND